MRRGHAGLPDGALVLFAVTRQNEYAVGFTLAFEAHGDAAGERKALAQRTGRELHPRRLEAVRVTLEHRVQLAQRP